MYHPSRGGVRGGTDQFSWDTVKTDKHRENYLGHSVMAPVGRWQKGKDLSWYAKERKNDDSVEKCKRDELTAIKKAEEDAMLVALGLKTATKTGQTLGKEEIAEILKQGSESRGSLDIERVQGVGTESGRAAMLLSDGKQGRTTKGVAFESQSQEKLKGNQLSQEPNADTTKIERSTVKSRKHKKEKKSKKKKKKHKRQYSDPSSEEGEGTSDTNYKSKSFSKERNFHRSKRSKKHHSESKSDCSSDDSHHKKSSNVHKSKHSSSYTGKPRTLSKGSSKRNRHDTSSSEDSDTSDTKECGRNRVAQVCKLKPDPDHSTWKAKKHDHSSELHYKYKHLSRIKEKDYNFPSKRKRHCTSESD